MRHSTLKTFLRAAPIVLTGAAMLFISWRRWADLIVDYGREVYVPWQLSKGSLLYRDIAAFYGPLSNYWNSVLFRLFGESLFPMQAFNIVLIACLTYIIYRLFEREDDGLSATVPCTAFLVLFALGKHFRLGSYNYVAPYSHELVHGVFLSFASIYALKLYVRDKRPLWVSIAGFLTGLVLLTKLEISFALIPAIISGFFFAIWDGRPLRPSGFLKPAGLFAAGVLVPLLFFIGFFSVQMGVVEALKSVFSSWVVVAGTDISSSKFYRAMTGLDDLSGNIRGMLTYALWYLLLFIPLVINYLLRNIRLARKYGGIVSFTSVGAVTAYFSGSIPWDLLFWPLPIFASAIVLFFGFKLIRSRDDEPARTIPLFALSVFSAAMLLKMLFVTRVYGYGFVLAMPATLLIIYMALSYIPAALEKKWVSSSIFRCSVLAAVSVMLSVYLIKSYKLYEPDNYMVGSGGDTIVASEFSGGKGVNILVEQINRIMAPEDDFIIMPEGALVNYLSRRKNPTKFISFLPSDMTIYGEDTILAALEKTPPDFIILISRDTIEYGAHYLGQGYGDKIYSFIMNGYTDAVRIGNMGFLQESTGMGQPLGMVIMKRIGAEP